MERSQLIQQIALTHLRNIGPILAKNLIAYFGGVEPIFTTPRSTLAKVLGISNNTASDIIESREDALRWAEEELSWVEKNGISTTFLTDASYSYRLRECEDSPLLLYSKGNINLNNGKFLGIVGTRHMTPYGHELVEKLVQDIAAVRKDVTIVSGLAYGVDITAHKAALAAGLPTIGVVAHGLHIIYPSEHRNVANQMLSQGGIITEFTNGIFPIAANFVQRNRIIAGLCDAVVVVESGKKGGSLITADFAVDYNRDVFTFPGRVGDMNSEGCNNLIMYNKANLIQQASDLFRIMNWEILEQGDTQQTILFDSLTPEEQQIISILRQNRETHVDNLSAATNMPLYKLNPILVRMEFEGKVKCLPGNLYKATI